MTLLHLTVILILAVLSGSFLLVNGKNRIVWILVSFAASTGLAFWFGYVVLPDAPNNTGISFGLPSNLEISLLFAVGIPLAILIFGFFRWLQQRLYKFLYNLVMPYFTIKK